MYVCKYSVTNRGEFDLHLLYYCFVKSHNFLEITQARWNIQIGISLDATLISMFCLPYSYEQKHVLLFRKSTLKGCFKLRHVTEQDMFIFRNFA